MRAKAKPAASSRLADMLGSLSLATDLAAGVPAESSIKTCAIAALLGQRLKLAAGDRSDAYFASLLRHLGCTAFSHEAATMGAGDDHHFLQTFEDVDPASLAATGTRAVRRLGKHATASERAVAVARVLSSPGTATALATAQCSQATALAADIGMSRHVVASLDQIYERFDGSGPRHLRGDQIELAARLLHAANVIEVQHRHGGRARATDEVRRRSGRHLDPNVASAFLADADDFWALLEPASIWDEFLDLEPEVARRVGPEELPGLALAFARFADLKIPSKVGHSPRVASLAERAGKLNGLKGDDLTTLRLAALLHDLGVVGVPNGIWEKRGPLNDAEWERVRLHAYFTQRILARAPGFDRVTQIASLDHERCDGGGYPRGMALPQSERAGRILAAADVYTAALERRPYRDALDADAAADLLRTEVLRGRLCESAVDCVLAAVGKAPPPSPGSHGAITGREAEVLVALGRGWTNKEIGVALGISAKTVQNHLASIYEKLGVSTRAGAALFAVRNNLVPGA